MEIISTLGVLLRVSVARLCLSLAAERAVKAVEETHFPLAHDVVKITGLCGFGSLLGCLGLGLAFLSIACGIALGSSGSMAIVKRRLGPLLETGVTGLTVLLGCGVGGAVLGSTLISVLTLGLRGLFLMGITLSLILLSMRLQQKAVLSTATAMLSFLAVAFMTMLVGVCVGTTMAGCRIIDPGKAIIPSLFFTIVLLIPAVFVLGILAETAFGKPNMVDELWISFGGLVAAQGFLVGLGIGYHHTPNALPYDTFSTIQSVVYNAEILAGVAGSLLGAMSVSSLDKVTAGGLSLWISIPAVVGLSTHGLMSEWYLGTGGELGLMLGLAGASGFALGSVVVSTGTPNSIRQFALLVFGVECGDFYKDSLSFHNLVVSMALTLAPMLAVCSQSDQDTARQQNGNRLILLADVSQSSAALGVVMMGASVMGAAGVLTAALGSASFCGVMLAALMTILKTINICSKINT